MSAGCVSSDSPRKGRGGTRRERCGVGGSGRKAINVGAIVMLCVCKRAGWKRWRVRALALRGAIVLGIGFGERWFLHIE